MAHILCTVPGPRHHHVNSAEARACWLAASGTSRPVIAPHQPHERDLYGHTSVIHVSSPPTIAQLDYVKKLGGDVSHARGLNRLACAQYIDRLKARPKGTRMSDVPAKGYPKDVQVIIGLLPNVPDGRYAVQPDSETPLTFLRVSRPKRGNFAGSLKVQTQHSDMLLDKFVIWPTGRVSVFDATIPSKLLLLITNAHQAAITYGRELGHCCRCGRALTDERSRYYGIGPECEESWPWVILEVDERDGAYTH